MRLIQAKANLQIATSLEKQTRAKEKELVDFQEKYKIRMKVCIPSRHTFSVHAVLLSKPCLWIHRVKEMEMQLLQKRPVAKAKRKELVC